MKKIMTFVLITGIVLSLCACNGGAGTESSGGEHAGEAGNAAGSTKRADGVNTGDEQTSVQNGEGKTENSENQAGGGLHFLWNMESRGCNTEDGYYYLSEDPEKLSDGRYGSHLMYMDFAAQQEIYLCSSAGCRHDSADCPSVLPEEDFPPYTTLIFTYGDSLYLLSKEQDMDGSMYSMMEADENGEMHDVEMESTPTVLYRAGLDGTNREKVYTFDSNITVEDEVLADDNGLYFIVKKLSAEKSEDGTYMNSSERRVICLDPSDWSEKTVCSMDSDDDILWSVAGCYDRKLVLKGTDYGRKVSNEELYDEDAFKNLHSESEEVYALFDLNSGKITESFRINNKDFHTDYVNGKMLYLAFESNGNVKSVDLSTGQEKMLGTLTNNSILTMIGDRLCCSSWDGTEDHTFYYMDVNTGEISHSGLVNKRNGWNLEFRGETASDVLVVYDYEATQLDAETYEITRYQYGLISKEDLFEGNDHYRTIKMIGKGK